MDRVSIWSTFKAKEGQEPALEQLLADCVHLLREEPGTTRTVLMRREGGGWAIFNTFADEDAFQAHLHGPVPKLLADHHDVLDGELTIDKGTITVQL